MSKSLKYIFPIILILSCGEINDKNSVSSLDPVNWKKRSVDIKSSDSLIYGSTYLSVYSQVYSHTEHITHNLTATVSMRNTNKNDTIFIKKAEYFDTGGKPIRSYFQHPILILPLETVEIVIDENDTEGGTGANFIFEWYIHKNSNDPLFEAVMISTSGQQGLSFTTQGMPLN